MKTFRFVKSVLFLYLENTETTILSNKLNKHGYKPVVFRKKTTRLYVQCKI